MYLHLGQDVVVPDKSVIGIFDIDNTTGSRVTRDFLSRAEKEGRIINISEDIPKSFIVCKDKNQTKIYLSQLSSSTLMKRGSMTHFN